jgi:hypothetical protein
MSRSTNDWIEGFMELTDNSEPPAIFRRWCAISVIASVLQRKCYLEWGMETFYPNFYIVLVGPPASRKGTAMRVVREMLDGLGINLAADVTSTSKLTTALGEAKGNVPHEKLGIATHSSLTIYSSELTVFLGYQNLELLANLCDWFDCRNRFTHDTHKHGEQEIVNVWVNLLGATTPMLLQTSLPEGSVGSGFTSRCIFVYSQNKGKVVIVPDLSESAQRLTSKLSDDLSGLYTMFGAFKCDDAFLALYTKWRYDSEDNNIFDGTKLDYYWQRRPSHLLRLAMVYSAARSDDKVLREIDFLKTLATLEEAEAAMPYVFQGVGANRLAPVQTRIMEVIRREGKVKLRDIQKQFFSDANASELSEILLSLVDMQFCTMDQKARIVTYTKVG